MDKYLKKSDSFGGEGGPVNLTVDLIKNKEILTFFQQLYCFYIYIYRQ